MDEERFPSFLTRFRIALLGLGVKAAEFLLITLWSKKLLCADFHWALLALDKSPYGVDAFQSQLLGQQTDLSAPELCYGETPWHTAHALLKRVNLQDGERFVDLGSGVGRVAYYAAAVFKAWSLGVEALNDRHHQARVVAAASRVRRLKFARGSVTEQDLTDADVVYLTWTCMSTETRRVIESKLQSLRAGARVICTTYPLQSEGFARLHFQRAWFSWGRGELHFFVRIAS